MEYFESVIKDYARGLNEEGVWEDTIADEDDVAVDNSQRRRTSKTRIGLRQIVRPKFRREARLGGMSVWPRRSS